MRWLQYNIPTILFVLLAIYMIHTKTPGYGWCIFLAGSFAIIPKTDNEKS